MRYFAIFLFWFSSSIAMGETVYLKNGTVLRGAIVEMSETNITLSTSDLGTVIIKRRSVAAITDGSTQVVPKPAPVTPVPTPLQPEPVAPLPPSPPLRQEITINQQNTPPTEVSPARAVDVVVPAPVNQSHAEDGGHLHSNLGIGYSVVTIDDDSYGMPSLHWDLLSFRTPSGSSFALYASGGEGDGARFASAGLKVDWAIARTRFKSGASSLSFGFSGGASRFEYTRDRYYDDYYYYYYYYKDDERIGGPSFGAQLAYNYLADDSFGFQVGVSGAKTFDEEQDYSIASGFGGISFVF